MKKNTKNHRIKTQPVAIMCSGSGTNNIFFTRSPSLRPRDLNVDSPIAQVTLPYLSR